MRVLTDTSNIEQLIICICWVDKEMTVCEECIGLMPVTQTNADTIVVCIKDVLLYMNLRFQEAVQPWLEPKMGLLHKSRN